MRTLAFAFAFALLGASAGCNAILGNGYGADDTAAGGNSEGGGPLDEGGGSGDGGPGADGMTTGDGSTLDGNKADGAGCPNGVCPTKVTDVVGPQRLALSAMNGLYWASLAGIGRVNLDGSNPKPMAIAQNVGAGLKRGIAVSPDGASAYVTMPGGGKGAAKCTADLASCAAGFIGSAGSASSIATDATKVYVGINDDQLGAMTGGIWQTAPDGTSALPYTMMTDNVLDLQIVAGTTYFRTATAINANTRTTMPTSVINLGGDAPLGFIVVGTKVFVTTASKHLQTCTVALFTTCMGIVVQLTAAKPSAITADATHVYWVESDAGTVHRCDVADCSTTHLLLADGQAAPNDIVVDGTSIYWANYGDTAGAGGAIMKLAK